MKDFKSDPEYVRRRRQIIREHHPDAGGSDERLIAELRKLDEQYDRRLSTRAQFESVRPDFISKEQADDAFQIAEQWITRTEERLGSLADKLASTAVDSATDLRKRADEVRVRAEKVRASTAEEIKSRMHDTPLEGLARRAGKAAGTVRNRISNPFKN